MDYITNYYQNLSDEEGRLFKDNIFKRISYYRI